MPIDISKIASSKVSARIGNRIGNALDKSTTLTNVISKFEPDGANNKFLTLVGLMTGTVILPRVLTAAKRNPDNKEATKDEISEILFRDIQTVAIVLFLLKIINSLAAAGTTAIKGLPMMNKPYEKLFKNNTAGNFLQKAKANATEFFNAPGEKLKTIGKNILDTIHPTEGIRALTNDEFVSKYSGYEHIYQIQEVFDNIELKGGNKEKVFKRLMNFLIAPFEAKEKEAAQLGTKLSSDREEKLTILRQMKEKGVSSLDNIDDKVKENFINFFKDNNNALVGESKGMNAILRTGALLFESAYLGFGLPALNQKRLEKKYLQNGGNKQKDEFVMSNQSGVGITSSNPAVRPQEVKLFKNFIK